MHYSFKRDLYYKLEDFVLNNKRQRVLFLLGPRKCGKTVALKQLELSLKDSMKVKYVDFRYLTRDEKLDITDMIIDSIKTDEQVCYLLDEVTYMHLPPEEMSRIADEFCAYKNLNIKIIFSGSQMIAVDSWGRRAFCSNAIYLSTGFLTYNEWLRWRNVSDVSKETFMEFCLDTFNFYDSFTTIEDYLRGCINETIQSNNKCSEIYQETMCDLVNVETLTDLTYLLLFKLHNNMSHSKLYSRDMFKDRIINLYKKDYKTCFESTKDLEDKITNSMFLRYSNVKSTTVDELKQSLLFLLQIGFITGTNVVEDVSERINLKRMLSDRYDSFKEFNEIIGGVNFTINYPMFYVAVMKELFGIDIGYVDGNTLGSIVETYLRGLLDNTNVKELRINNNEEIDYIDSNRMVAIEFTVSNKKLNDVKLSLLGKDYLKILLTKDKYGFVKDDILRIPFAEFIYEVLNGLDVFDIYNKYCKKTSVLNSVYTEAIKKD